MGEFLDFIDLSNEVQISPSILFEDGFNLEQIEYLRRIPIDERSAVLCQMGFIYSVPNQYSREVWDHFKMLKLLK